MAGSGKKALYDENGDVVGEVKETDVAINGRFIVECPDPKGHLYLIAPETLRHGDSPECPVCRKHERKDD